MWPLLFCSIISFTVILQKISFLSFVLKKLTVEEQVILDAVNANKVLDAILFINNQPSLSGHIFKAGLLKYATTRNEITDAIEESVRKQIPAFEQGMNLLLTLVSIVPLLGFLGSVLGFYQVFHSVSVHAQAMNPAVFAEILSGLRQALISTLIGLFLGILFFMAYNFLVNNIHQTLQRIEFVAENLVEALITPTRPCETHREFP